MIIKSKPISASSGSFAIFNHLAQKIDDNEYIDVLEGSRQNIDNCVSDAKNMNRTNSVIHFILSSDEAITREQALKCTTMLGNEFEFSGDEIMLMAKHGKERHNGTSDNKHWHFLVRANNPETEKTLNLSNAYKRQELVARTFEIENNLKLTQGRHNKYVYHNIDEKYKELIAPLCEGDLPNSFTHDKSAQLAKREGRDLFTLKDEAKHIFAESSSWNDFKDKIAERGWTIEQGTKKPDVLILNDENGKLIGSVSRVLGIKKDELNNIIESPDSYIASRVTGGTSPISAPVTADEGQAPSTPQKPIEQAQEPSQEQTTQPQQTAPEQPEIGSNTETSQEIRAETNEAMTQEEKLAISEFNKQLSEKEKLSKEELSNQEKRIKDFLKSMEIKQQPKLQPKTWNNIIEDREKSLLNIIDQPHPTIKTLTHKQTKDFLYKNFKNELDQFYNDRKELCELRKDIRNLKQNNKWYNFIGNKKLSKKEAEEKENREKLKLLAMYIIHCVMNKIGLNTVRPNPYNYLTEQQKKDYEIQFKENKYAQMLFNNSDRSKCLDSIAVLKVFENDSELMKWKSRDEVINAKKSLQKLNIVRDINILTLDEIGQKEFKQAQENLDIEQARKAVIEAHKREDQRYLMDVREPENEQNQDNDKEKSNVVEFPKNNNIKKKKSFPYGR